MGTKGLLARVTPATEIKGPKGDPPTVAWVANQQGSFKTRPHLRSKRTHMLKCARPVPFVLF